MDGFRQIQNHILGWLDVLIDIDFSNKMYPTFKMPTEFLDFFKV